MARGIFTAKFVGLTNVVGGMKTLRKQLVTRANQGVNNIAKAAAVRARDLTPKRTGATAQGWVSRPVQAPPLTFSREVVNVDPNASKLVTLADGRTTNLLEMLEYGTRPHIITPKLARVLAFVVGGSTVFSRRVSHPGTRPYAMMRITTDEAQMQMTAFLKALSRVIDQLARR